MTDPPNRRQRARAATLEEIKQTALELMHEHGSLDVRFTDIARTMGLTAPALYRYFADRDELLTALVTDSFDHLAAALAAGRESAPAGDLGARLLATGAAYRAWASEHPQRFSLIFGVPVPGYAAPEGGPTVDAAQRAMGNFAELVLAASVAGKLRPPLVTETSPDFAAFTAEQLGAFGGAITPETYQAMLLTWTGLHGFVCLEAYGQFCWMPAAIRDELFLAQIRAGAAVAGLPLP